MKLSHFLGWIIGAIDLVCMAYALVDLTPFILMVGISLVYIAITVLKRSMFKEDEVDDRVEHA